MFVYPAVLVQLHALPVQFPKADALTRQYINTKRAVSFETALRFLLLTFLFICNVLFDLLECFIAYDMFDPACILFCSLHINPQARKKLR